MSARSTQTAEGEAVYRLNEQLRVRYEDGTKVYLAAGTDATATQLRGLVISALEEGGLIKKISEASTPCEICKEQGSAAEKKGRFSPQDLAGHYREKHPAFAPPEEV